MQIYREKAELERAVSALKQEQKSIGFVPTMGALHEGHFSLVRKAAEDCEAVVVSIFINPTQFDNQKDLENYPRTLEKDVAALEELRLPLLVFAPNASEMYGEKVEAEEFTFGGLENEMEGKFRSGHFNGVGTVVKRLFEIVKPDKAFFGEKDYQQLQIIKKMTYNNQLPVEIVGCSIDREENGLARSSRNARLNPQLRKDASLIYNTLLQVKKRFGKDSVKEITEWVQQEFASKPGFKLEYFEIAEETTLKTAEKLDRQLFYRAFIAVYAGDVRLIDNIALN